MYPATKTHWLEPTGQQNVGLRRYATASGQGGWTCEAGYHSALVITSTRELVLDDDGNMPVQPKVDHADPNWPTHCEHGCDYAFTETDHWQEWGDRLYRRTDTGELTTLRDAAPGACWDASWIPFDRGVDGIYLMVKCPNGRDWSVDSQASNCTRKGDKSHKCWIRHGDPRECKVTVDKNGQTCAAGAGSILAGDYHGFLQAGVLTAG